MRSPGPSAATSARPSGRIIVTATDHATSIQLVPFTVVSPPRCSTAAWDWPSSRHWRRASARRTRVQDIAGAAHHAGNRPDQGRRRRPELRPPYRHRRRTGHRWQGAPARSWHDHVPDLPELNAPSRDRHCRHRVDLERHAAPTTSEYTRGALYGLAAASIWAAFIVVSRLGPHEPHAMGYRGNPVRRGRFDPAAVCHA